MKILTISQVYYPDTASTAQHLSDLLENLVVRGHEVYVITSQRKYENPKETFPKNEVYKGVCIKRIKNTGYGKKNKVTRLIDFLSFNILIAFYLFSVKKKEYDIILGMTSPPLLSYIGIKIARFKKIKFVYWTMDLQPELSIVAGYLKKGSRVANSLQKRGDYVFKHAAKIIALDKYMVEHIQKRLDSEHFDIDVIPVWPVMSEVYLGPRLENPFRVGNKFGKKIVIMYSGNHSVMHSLTTLLKTAQVLNRDERFLFVHIGGGVRLKEVIEFKKNNTLENILLLPYQPREKIHFSLGAADIQVVSLGDGSVGYTHPNKIYGSMFIGKPILYIGPYPSHVTDILDECPGNIIVQHGNVDGLVTQLKEFALLSEEERDKIGLRNKKFAEANFHSKVLINKMTSAFELIKK